MNTFSTIANIITNQHGYMLSLTDYCAVANLYADIAIVGIVALIVISLVEQHQKHKKTSDDK